MNKKTAMVVGITMILTLIASNKLKALPGLNKLPSV